jgi:hypothetical protein
LDDALIHAARGGNLGLTELCKELGDRTNRNDHTITYNKLHEAMAAAAGGGHEAIMNGALLM